MTGNVAPIEMNQVTRVKKQMKCNLMRDPDIRRALVDQLGRRHPRATLFHEFPLVRGEGRADVLLVNGSIHGYEIKSDCDSLVRLETQQTHYDRTCEYVTLIVTAKHLAKAISVAPSSWGLCVARQASASQVRIKSVKEPEYNRPAAEVLIRMLWKTECIRLLRAANCAAEEADPIRQLWQRLESLPANVLEHGVRAALKQRRSPIGRQPTQCGD